MSFVRHCDLCCEVIDDAPRYTVDTYLVIDEDNLDFCEGCWLILVNTAKEKIAASKEIKS